MHMPSLWGLLIVLALAFILFGKPGRLSSTMEDLGKGIRGFRKGMDEGANPPPPAASEPPRQVADQRPTENTGDRVQS